MKYIIYLILIIFLIYCKANKYQQNFYLQDSETRNFTESAQFIIDNYNANDFNALYNKLSYFTKLITDKKKFIDEFQQIKNQRGNIFTSYVLGFIKTNCYQQLVAGITNLDIGGNIFCLSRDNKFDSLQLVFPANQSVLTFAQTHNSSQTALSILKNNILYVSKNNIENVPLMSTFKIMVAIVYAQQVVAGTINPNEMIDIESQLNLYYLPNIDNEHANWLNQEQQAGKIINGKIALNQIPLGMIQWSSNCNTEFLQDLLGIQNIQNFISSLNLTHHDPLFYLASSMLAMQNSQGLPYNAWIQQLSTWTQNDLILNANTMHQMLKNDPNGNIRKNDSFFLNPTVMDIYSKLFISSTSSDYTKVMNLINQEQYFPKQVEDLILQILGIVPMSSSWGQAHYARSGVKGGGSSYPNMTQCVLSMAGYETDIQGNQTSMMVEFHNMTFSEFQDRNADLNDFITMVYFSNQYLSIFSQRISQSNIMQDLQDLFL